MAQKAGTWPALKSNRYCRRFVARSICWRAARAARPVPSACSQRGDPPAASPNRLTLCGMCHRAAAAVPCDGAQREPFGRNRIGEEACRRHARRSAGDRELSRVRQHDAPLRRPLRRGRWFQLSCVRDISEFLAANGLASRPWRILSGSRRNRNLPRRLPPGPRPKDLESPATADKRDPALESSRTRRGRHLLRQRRHLQRHAAGVGPGSFLPRPQMVQNISADRRDGRVATGATPAATLDRPGGQRARSDGYRAAHGELQRSWRCWHLAGRAVNIEQRACWRFKACSSPCQNSPCDPATAYRESFAARKRTPVRIGISAGRTVAGVSGRTFV